MRKSSKLVRRRAPRRKVVRRRRAARKGIVEAAQAKYSTMNQLLQPAQSMTAGGGVYAFRNFSLAAASTRIQNIAQGYQEFRIKRVIWECRGFFDTFVAPSSATAPTVPHLYWRLDRVGGYNSDTTLNTLKASGCRPIRLDDKLVRRSFKPSVLYPVSVAPANAGSSEPVVMANGYKISPWLATNANAYITSNLQWAPSTVDHMGLIVSIDCDVVPFSSAAAISFTVEYEFRKPLDDIDPNGQTTVEVIDLADLQPKKQPAVEEVK